MELNKRQILLILDSLQMNINDYDTAVVKFSTYKKYPSIKEYYLRSKEELEGIKTLFEEELKEKTK